MGYIPVFLTVSAACILFFLTVKNSFQKKLNRQGELHAQLRNLLPDLETEESEISDPEIIIEKLKLKKTEKKVLSEVLKIIRELKINRLQYNQLIKKAPYNWVAKISGFQSI